MKHILSFYFSISLLPIVGNCQNKPLSLSCRDTIYIFAYKYIGFEQLNNSEKVYYSGNNIFHYCYFKQKEMPSFNSVIGQAQIDCQDCKNCFYYIIKRKNGKICAEGNWVLGEYTFETIGKEYYKNGNLKKSYKNTSESGEWVYYNRKGKIIKRTFIE